MTTTKKLSAALLLSFCVALTLFTPSSRAATEVDGKLKVDAGTITGVTTVATVTNVATIGTSVTPGFATANLGKAEDAPAGAGGGTGVLMIGVRKDSATQETSADADYGAVSLDAYGAQFVRPDHPNRIHCTSGSPLAVSTATALTVLNGCAAPGASLSIYITDINFSTNVSGIAADTFNTLKYGTGGACGTGTTMIWGAFSAAAAQDTVIQQLRIPIKIPANNELCWINSTAGSKVVIVDGFIAP